MFSRRFHRLPVNLDAILITEETNLPCFIDNISEGGLRIWIITKTSIDLTAASFVKLEFRVTQYENHEPLEKVISLTCEIMWVDKKPRDGLSLGLKVVDKDSSYENFVKALYMKKVGIL